ncbi:MAG: hypothetical protein ACOX9R_06885 [Armatimonadota bacterium]
MIHVTRSSLTITGLVAICALALLALTAGQVALAQEAGADAPALGEAVPEAATSAHREIVPYQFRGSRAAGADASGQERDEFMELIWPRHLGADGVAMIFGGSVIEAGGYYGGGTTGTTGGYANTGRNVQRGGYDRNNQGVRPGGGYGPGRGMQQGDRRGMPRPGSPMLNSFGTIYR